MDKTDIIIIGAGVVGLAVAAELAQRRPRKSIVVFEQNECFGRETSSRNSEVIHAGIYYPTDSLKARLCVAGKKKLYSYLHEWKIGHRHTGKLIIARNESEMSDLEALYRQACDNGVLDLIHLDKSQLYRLEPYIRAHFALLSPSTGIIHSHRLMERLECNAVQEGALIAYCHSVTNVEPQQDGYAVYFNNPDGSSDSMACSQLINCAGLFCDQIAAMAGIDIDQAAYRLVRLKGEYFSVTSGKALKVSRLIYTVPEVGLKSLGIHTTKTLDNRLRLGPSAFFVDELEYSVDEANRMLFYDAVKDFLPFLKPEDLEPEMAGIRPKLKAEPGEVRDFIIRDEADKGFPGLINLIGIESPGLTACLSIGELVADIAEGRSNELIR